MQCSSHGIHIKILEHYSFTQLYVKCGACAFRYSKILGGEKYWTPCDCQGSYLQNASFFYRQVDINVKSDGGAIDMLDEFFL